MANPTAWAEDDVLEAIRLKEAGLTWEKVANIFGKSRSSTQSAVARYRGKQWTKLDRASGDAIGKEQTDIDFECDAKLGSIALEEAIKGLRSRMPMRVLRYLDGPASNAQSHSTPILRGQFAERLLAA